MDLINFENVTNRLFNGYKVKDPVTGEYKDAIIASVANTLMVDIVKI